MHSPTLIKNLAKAELKRRANQSNQASLGMTVDDSSYLSAGPLFEELQFDLRGKVLPAKLLAYYLPQFYPFPENDEWWGKGFTEWRNVTRARPRFTGHHQPHLPLDLGYYDLRNVEIMRQQSELAQKAGIHAWCFYYYRFGNKRLLDVPVNNFLDNKDIQMPFCLMWANEDWTRSWDGKDDNIILGQDYSSRHDDEFIDDLARHFNDSRYFKLNGKPLFYIYRPIHIPDAERRIEAWRELLIQRYGIDMTVHMVQYKTADPRRFNMDGAIEFPPHKLNKGIEQLNKNNHAELPLLNKSFTGTMFRYEDMVKNSLAELVPDYDLIRCVAPDWDNEPRRPNAGIGYLGSTPEKYEKWLKRMIEYSLQNPVQGESIVAINAWNEWAESAHLEPDVYYGSAYLNATARALLAKI